MRRIAIINSRQALRPTGATDWVRATSAAVKTLRAEGEYVFLSSLGETTFELTLSCLSAAGATVEIVLTGHQVEKYAESEAALQQYLASEFRLPAERTSLVCIGDETADARYSSHVRDRGLLSLADIIVPVSIRPGGFWKTQLAEDPLLSARADNRFAISYQTGHTHIKRRYDRQQLNSMTASRLAGHLIHWTRTSNHPWPGETHWEFYRDLFEAQATYPRSAWQTLRHILSEKRIRGSTRHMPNAVAMVSLTSASLAESALLMKYRARYREMTIEPFAIAFPLEAAGRMGACQVSYYSAKELAQLSEKEKLFAHARGSDGAGWEKEKEWRIRGDVALSPLWKELIVIVENQNQADKIESDFGLRAFPVFAE